MKKALLSILFALIFVSSITTAQEYFRSGIFLHHSTGSNIWGPNGGNTSIPQEIEKYNQINGLTGDKACSFDEAGWPVDPWNNDWFRWNDIFHGTDETADITPYLQQNKIIMIKSCYPSSAMTGQGSSDDLSRPNRRSMWNYKYHWRKFISKMAEYPDNFFVVWNNAPLCSQNTTQDAADLSHEFCSWTKEVLEKGLDEELGEFPKNVMIFDFFHYTCDDNYMLREEFMKGSGNSHPNGSATEYVAPILVKEMFDAAIAYEQIVSSIEDEGDTLSIQIMPNPVNENSKVVIRNAEQGVYNLSFYDSNSKNITKSHQITIDKDEVEFQLIEYLDVDYYATGIYFMHFKKGNTEFTRKFQL